MDIADDHARRTSFGTVVDASRYDDVRPEYPAEAVSWLLERAPGPAPLRVLDLAAGTGKLTRVLRQLGHRVVAVDPSPPMLDAMPEALGADEGVELVTGTAESVPLPDASVDAVTVGQAWHWVRPHAAVSEAVRVLRPGGVLGLVWNARDLSSAWVRELDALVEGGDRGIEGAAVTSEDDWWPRVPRPLGDSGERRVVRADQVLPDARAVVALASTYSGVAVRHDRDAVLARVHDLAAANAGPGGEVVIPMLCLCFRYRRP